MLHASPRRCSNAKNSPPPHSATASPSRTRAPAKCRRSSSPLAAAAKGILFREVGPTRKFSLRHRHPARPRGAISRAGGPPGAAAQGRSGARATPRRHDGGGISHAAAFRRVKKSQNAKCKMQKSEGKHDGLFHLLTFAFCILHFDFCPHPSAWTQPRVRIRETGCCRCSSCASGWPGSRRKTRPPVTLVWAGRGRVPRGRVVGGVPQTDARACCGCSRNTTVRRSWCSRNCPTWAAGRHVLRWRAGSSPGWRCSSARGSTGARVRRTTWRPSSSARGRFQRGRVSSRSRRRRSRSARAAPSAARVRWCSSRRCWRRCSGDWSRCPLPGCGFLVACGAAGRHRQRV